MNHVTIIDATGAPPANDMAIIITGSRLAAIDKAESVRIPAGAEVIDGRGKFVIPGLADMHNHLFIGAPAPNRRMWTP